MQAWPGERHEMRYMSDCNRDKSSQMSSIPLKTGYLTAMSTFEDIVTLAVRHFSTPENAVYLYAICFLPK
jgi:hypothetical protein